MKGYILRGVQTVKDANGKITKDTIYVGTDGHTCNFAYALRSPFVFRKDAEEHATRFTAMCNLPDGYQKDHGIHAHADECGAVYFSGRLENFSPVTKWEILDISEILSEYKSYQEFIEALIADWLAGRKLRYEPVPVNTKKADALTNAWVLEEKIKTLSDTRHSVNWMERERRSQEERLNARKADLIKQTKTVSDLMSKIRNEFGEATSADPELKDFVGRLQNKFNNIKHSEQKEDKHNEQQTE